jgi:hypothetical protein
MLVYIDNIVFSMGSYITYSHSILFKEGDCLYVNTVTGEFDYYCNPPSSSWLLFPVASDIYSETISTYINQLDNEKHKQHLLMQKEDEDFDRIFHWFTEDYDLVDDFSTFKKNYWRDIARKWCEDNGVEYTNDPMPYYE